jgi:signal transduction histidine kinase
VVAGRILRPIREVTLTARAIGDTDLSGRIDVEGDDEIAELASTFNAMLDRLESAFATQRQFLDDAGHELRTPITVVSGHLELLGDDPDERRETIALVTDELDRMSRIVNDLLLLAKLDRPGLLRPEVIAVEPFTAELFAKARTLDRAGPGATTPAPAPRPSRWHLDQTAEVTLVADPQRLTQAVMNLARNAVEHAGPGASIRMGSAARNGHVEFWVADDGAGIAEDQRSTIFDRFSRGGDGLRRSDGAGLGLAIVKAVAEAHAGSVALESRPGEGARFTVAIPRQFEEVPA